MRTSLVSILLVVITVFYTSCSSSKNTTIFDRYVIIKNENEAGLNFKKLSGQEDFLNKHQVTRGLIDGYLISLATDGIKKMIDARHEKYSAEFNMALSDLRFYNDLSTNGVFDPQGIKFKGFSLVRLVENSINHREDTAFIADFELDTGNPYEIINNSQFRLRLKNLDYRFPKVLMKDNHPTVNMDFEITINGTYVNEQGALYKNVMLGKFYLCLTNMPVNKRTSGYNDYYTSLQNMRFSVTSFIVPQSYGYYLTNNNQLSKCYSWGNYSIAATVRESSEEKFVDKIIYDNSGFILKGSSIELQKGSEKLEGLLKKKRDKVPSYKR